VQGVDVLTKDIEIGDLLQYNAQGRKIVSPENKDNKFIALSKRGNLIKTKDEDKYVSPIFYEKVVD